MSENLCRFDTACIHIHSIVLTVFLCCYVNGLAEVASGTVVNGCHSYTVEGERLQVVQRVQQYAYGDVVYGAAGGGGPVLRVFDRKAAKARLVLGQLPMQDNAV